ncbi:branched-chain amino acid ABC transporter permease [Liberiplasma polymorphum]|uniref:branched-chain amino acid ABC transporter permease n=1 Tax=Liberiplasma polymorphum TaxID=3374570 RepID=UPI00377385B1
MNTLNKLENFFGKISVQFKKYPLLPFITFGALIMLIAFMPGLNMIRWSTMSVFAYIVIYTVVALGLNILLGFSGLISLGTAGFVGAGALGTSVFMNMGFPFGIAVILALVCAGLIGALIGIFSLKVDGIYLAIATLFVGEILSQIYTQISIFGGESLSFESIKLFGFLELSNNPQQDRVVLFILITIAMTICMLIMHNIVKSRTGRALMAMSRSQHAAQAMGVSLIKYRLTAFILATLFATFGGALYTLYFQNVPTRAWTLDLSLFIIAMVVVGGFKSIIGTFLGAFIIHGVPNLYLKDYFGDISYIFSGVLIILVILFYPNGFVYIWYDIKRLYYKFKIRISKRQVKPNDKG